MCAFIRRSQNSFMLKTKDNNSNMRFRRTYTSVGLKSFAIRHVIMCVIVITSAMVEVCAGVRPMLISSMLFALLSCDWVIDTLRACAWVRRGKHFHVFGKLLIPYYQNDISSFLEGIDPIYKVFNHLIVGARLFKQISRNVHNYVFSN